MIGVMEMKLLKIGPLKQPINRWLDSLEIFDEVYVLQSMGTYKAEGGVR